MGLGMGSGRLKYLVAAFQIKIRVIASQRLINGCFARLPAPCLRAGFTLRAIR